MNALKKRTTNPPPLASWPGLRRKPTKEASVSSRSEDGSPPPGLRRAPTLTLEDKSPLSPSASLTNKKSLSKTGSVLVGEVVTSPALPKTVSVVEGENVVTTLTKLTSGSSVGKSTSFISAPPAITKELSSSSVKSNTPIVAKSISRGGSIVLETNNGPSLSRSSSKSKSGTSASGVALEKVLSLSKALSKTSLTKEKSAKLIAAAVEEAAVEADGDGGAVEEEEDGGAETMEIPLPPGGLMEIVFSFDTTGSMYNCLNEVRERISDMVQRLQSDIPGIRIAVFAHGDYDTKDPYIIQWIDFGASTIEICKFVKEVRETGGRTYPEAYELVLRRCQSVLSWTPGSQRSLVMIGDAIPHEANEGVNTESIDWRTECNVLRDMAVRIYSIHANDRPGSAEFFKEMATITNGKYLELKNFSNIFDMMMAICYRERGEDFLGAYELEVRARNDGKTLNKDLEGMFGSLKKGDKTQSKTNITVAVGNKTVKASAVKKLKGAVMAKGAAKKTKGVGKPKITATKTKATERSKKKEATSVKAKAKKTAKPKTAKPKIVKPTKTKTKVKPGSKRALQKTTGRGKSKKEELKSKKVKNSRQSKIQRIFRERLSDIQMSSGGSKTQPVKSPMFKRIEWSNWENAMLPEKEQNGDTVKYNFRSGVLKRRSNGAPGFVKVNIFKKQFDCPDFYEFGVRKRGALRKRVFAMMHRSTAGFQNKGRWDRYLLNNKLVNKEINGLLQRGGELLVRRGVMRSYSKQNFRDFVRFMSGTFDYAWNRHKSGPQPHRTIIRTKLLMSGAKCN